MLKKTKPSIIDVSNIEYIENNDVLPKISFSISVGDILTIVGHNGSGKSTILKKIANLTKTNGSIKIANNTKIGYMPQRIFISKLMPMKVIDFLKLRNTKIDYNLIDRLGVRCILEKEMQKISGGQIQKVLFLTTIMGDCDLFLLDEPEQNLDKNSRKTMYDIINEKKKNSAIIIVSHDPDLILQCSNIVISIGSMGFAYHDDHMTINDIESIKDIMLCDGTQKCYHKHLQ